MGREEPGKPLGSTNKTKLPTASGLSKLMNLFDPGLNIWKWAGTRPAGRNQFQDVIIGHVLYAAEIGHHH